MTFYRVSYSQEGGNSGGYSWHTSRAAATAAFAEARKNDPAEYADDARFGVKRITQISITPTKAGILAALNRYASEPTNG